ncbi:AraC family transcriptional regulator (plasmid) [Hymenobacter tibetensis]|uniref:AraC family transcriptional regulator n=2 Tax=Hymenobacter tibetensis TaxID=497967 RepID=A0ABY4D522_9BACT|nr:AraC family transcriptional regulator [Hymenobacter tibetensis]UOG77458.1 AraC family transcriptional regulator [Hymenobacter tibetensis]
MKPQLLKISLPSECSFSIRQDVVPHFYNRWHYHAEVELVHIQQGHGTQFVGDSIQRFAPGDVLLIGANLPHYWRCDAEYFASQSGLQAQATVVHFLPDFWGTALLDLPESRALSYLLEQARRGIRLHGPVRDAVRRLLARLLTATGVARLVLLLRILTLVAAEEVELLASSPHSAPGNEADTERINRIYAYSLAHFQQAVPLTDIAAVANLSVHSFCRYFKAHTRKSYSRFLLELRVRHACQLLHGGSLSIAQVCYESGFNQFSSFNKYFKQITGMAPLYYRQTVQRGAATI